MLSVRYSVYKEKRPVTPSELWNNKGIKEILTKTTVIKTGMVMKPASRFCYSFLLAFLDLTVHNVQFSGFHNQSPRSTNYEKTHQKSPKNVSVIPI